jgi:hypothetical protein
MVSPPEAISGIGDEAGDVAGHVDDQVEDVLLVALAERTTRGDMGGVAHHGADVFENGAERLFDVRGAFLQVAAVGAIRDAIRLFHSKPGKQRGVRRLQRVHDNYLGSLGHGALLGLG